MNNPTSKTRFVVLEGIQRGNRFFSSYRLGDRDPTKSYKGETWYKVLGYADTSEEAQRILFPTKADADKALRDYMVKTSLQMVGLLPMDA